ncbi:MAG: inositol monophosphatase family protein [Acidimicrobiia bacterium]
MSEPDLDALVVLAERAARAGGSVVVDGFGDATNIREKSPGDWVSDVDTGSERAIAAVLAAGAPEIPFFGEESGGERAALGWICDPLDGTANFLHGFPAVGVSVALVADGVPIVGVVHAPLLQTTYVATRGGGAFRDGTPLRVSDRGPDQAMVATGFPFRHEDLKDPYLGVFGRALQRFEDLRRAGAASLDLAWTAAGVFDGYFELRLGPWDVAAGALLVREAGGVVTDWTGDDRAWLESGDIVVGPSPVHAEILRLAAESGVRGSGSSI